jgi:hypothetical protein
MKLSLFAKSLASAEWFEAANKRNYCKVALYKETSYFQAAFFVCARL